MSIMKERIAITNLFSFICLIILCYAKAAMAVPANPVPSTVSQPDGSIIEVEIKGDEWHNWVEKKGGFTIGRDQNTQQWFYVDHYQESTPVLTTIPADQNPPSSLHYHTIPAKKGKTGPAEDTLDQQSLQNSSLRSQLYTNVPSHAAEETFSGHVLFILASFNTQN